jgi:hypothetical protein
MLRPCRGERHSGRTTNQRFFPIFSFLFGIGFALRRGSGPDRAVSAGIAAPAGVFHGGLELSPALLLAGYAAQRYGLHLPRDGVIH